MIRILGSTKRLCDGLTRRDLLQIGGLGAWGLTTADWLAIQEATAAPVAATDQFGRAKACILVFLFGSPPQHETFDPKPEAPAEIQGELKSIATSLPGLQISERLPRMAGMMDRVTLVRSMSHPYPLHGVAYAVSGIPTYTPAIETKPRDKSHWPFLGSVVDYLEEQKAHGRVPEVPRNIGLPWLFGSKSDLAPLAGPYAAFLGSGYDPIWTDFDGKGSKTVPRLNEKQTSDVYDPFAGVTSKAALRLSDSCRLPGEVTSRRLESRRLLLSQFDTARATLEKDRFVQTYNKHQQRAFSLLTSNKVRNALDLNLEPAPVREKYGLNLFGQSLLAARRLVEAGSKFVTVFWDPFGPYGGSCWDTHANHFPRLKEYLLPIFDQSFPAFLGDMDDRGMLDETAVLCISEHGRTPKIDSKPKGAGRHHWSRAYSAVYAGGGFARGNVVGKTDDIAGDVVSNPVSPKDILATTFHLLGIAPETTVRDRLNRPYPIAGSGKVRRELLDS